MKISEIFTSIQGEGVNCGRPGLFIRLIGCNLVCCYCDSKYALSGGKKMIFNELPDYINGLGLNIYRIIWTGGEPLLQQGVIIDTLLNLKRDFLHEVETNGTIEPDNALIPVIHLWTVSPKLSNSMMEKKVNKDVLKFFNGLPNSVFKFVNTVKDDFDEAVKLIEELKIERGRVFMMPEGVSESRIKHVSKWLVTKCIEYGYNFSPRLQIWLWGNKRGV